MEHERSRHWGWRGMTVGVVLGVLSACRAGNASGPITFEAEWPGTTSASAEPREWVITDPAQWEEVWQETHPEIPPTPAPTIDFSRSMVIGVALGQRRSGGYEVRIIEITDTGTELVAHVEQMPPPPDAITIMMLTQPFHLVQVPRSSLPVRFEWNEPPDSPEGLSSPPEGVY